MGLLPFRQILYHLSYQESPRYPSKDTCGSPFLSHSYVPPIFLLSHPLSFPSPRPLVVPSPFLSLPPLFFFSFVSLLPTLFFLALLFSIPCCLPFSSFNPAFIKLYSLESRGEIVKALLLASTPRVSNSVDLHWDLRMCISSNFQGLLLLLVQEQYIKSHFFN